MHLKQAYILSKQWGDPQYTDTLKFKNLQECEN